MRQPSLLVAASLCAGRAATVLAARRAQVAGPSPAPTLLVVTRLVRPERLLEVEVVAVLPR